MEGPGDLPEYCVSSLRRFLALLGGAEGAAHLHADVPLCLCGSQVDAVHGVGGRGVCPPYMHYFAFLHIKRHAPLVCPVHQVVETLLEGCDV